MFVCLNDATTDYVVSAALVLQRIDKEVFMSIGMTSGQKVSGEICRRQNDRLVVILFAVVVVVVVVVLYG